MTYVIGTVFLLMGGEFWLTIFEVVDHRLGRCESLGPSPSRP